MILVLAGPVLAGCTANKIGAPLSTASTKPMTHEAILAEARILNEAYKKNPDDPATAFRFAQSLKHMGSKNEGVAVLASTAKRHPGDKVIVAAYGKSLLSVGRAEEAVSVLKHARTLDGRDWRVASALGLAHDQLKRHGEARRYYADAVALAPGESSIHNNAGLSFALDGDLKSAEKTLRIASRMEGAETRIRQNLALILGLQGRFNEARKVSGMDLPSEKAEQNTAYLRNMLAQPNAWSQLAKIDNAEPAPKRRYKKVFAAVPARKPIARGEPTSVGGPLVAYGQDQGRGRASGQMIELRSLERTTVFLQYPTEDIDRTTGGVPDQLVVANTVLPPEIAKGGGVPD